MSLEKQTRSGADTHSTARVLVTIVQLSFEAGDWSGLNERIIDLVKKRSQLKQAVAKMVTESCTFLDKTPDKATMMKLIDTLRTVTAGKIYVENERARLTHRLAKIHEKDGKVEEAAKIMQELQVETYGSMERQEKVELILEQMRLCLLTQDYIRAQIISKKISVRFFDNQKYHELKLKFYGYMIELGQHEHDYLGICKHYRSVQDTDSVREDLPKYQEVLEKFTTKELISQASFSASYEPLLRDGSEATGVFSRDEAGEKRWVDLKARVVEHNIRMMAQYYTKIRLGRMATLLALTEAETEDCLSDMVVAGTVSAKTDRLEGIVDFTEQQDPLENLNTWSYNTNKLMDLVMKTTHLINKEEMVHKHLGAGAVAAAE